ncbi:MAG: hypothetical protein Q8P11_00245 [bacterium]|nr:hypothetical protein [bacterium]
MRDSKNSRFKKTISTTLEDFDFIEKERHKKSKAGKLEEIIAYYKKYNLKLDTNKK